LVVYRRTRPNPHALKSSLAIPRSPACFVSAFLACVAGSATASDSGAEPPLEEIVVTASLLQQTVAEIPTSVTVLGAPTLSAAGLQHFEDVLGLVPNLNWSGGTSRPRFFQVRGIGELEQYQGAPNPSVGFLLDDIDLSGVGMPATLFDGQQVEVLRGPQGTRYGANALAGLIKVKTHDATPQRDLQVEVMGADYGTWSAGIAAGDAIGDAGSAWRLVAQKYQGDGYIHNAFLGRDDTNGRDETTLRGKLRLQLGDDWRADVAAMYVDLDNGFDAFTPDNSLRSLADRPGRDAQRTHGVSADVQGHVGPYLLSSVTAYASSDSVYSFDGDWGNNAYWGIDPPYDYFSNYQRNRSTLTEDLRLESKGDRVDWAAGAYVLRLEEDSLQRDYFDGALSHDPLVTNYSATSIAGYGEAVWHLPHELALTTGLRAETRAASYDDSDGASFAPRNSMVGGHVSLEGPLGLAGHWYGTVSRGYKAGGFNIGWLVPENRREFQPEYLWNAELGVRFSDADARWQGDVAIFHMWRKQEQVSTSFQLDPGDPLSYVFYTDNAAEGRNYGLEASGSWRAWSALQLGATLGLLHSEYIGYMYGDRNLDGREQAHAPSYQYSLFVQWGGDEGWMARADLNGVDAFYFDASHDQRSQPYTLLNLKTGYTRGHWSAYAWARNVTNENYAVRGFYFGLEPPDYPNKLYVQRGDARLVGVTVQWHW
jgi:outer membrane receptor protein involved in Fe transport